MISPLELKNKEFSRKLLGYDRNEVDDFLKLLIGDYEVLFRFHRKTTGAAEAPNADAVDDRPYENSSQSQEPACEQREKQEAPIEAPVKPSEKRETDAAGIWDDAGRNIRDILEMARKAAEDSGRAAEAKAEILIGEASAEAARIARETDEKVKAAERRLADLSAQESALRARMRGFLEVYRQLIEDFEETSGIDYSL